MDQPPSAGGFLSGFFTADSSDTSTIFLGLLPSDTHDTLLKQLTAGNVSITTASGGARPGDITFNDAVSLAITSNLTFTAGRNININQSISNSGGGGIALNAATLLTLSGTGDVGLSNAPVSFTAPSVALSKTGGDIYLVTTGGVSLSGSTTTPGGSLSLAATGGDITQSGALTIAGTTKLDASAHNIVLTNGNNDFSGGVALSNTAGDVSITDTNSLELGASSIGGDLTVNTTGAITQSPSTALTVSGAASFTSGANPITLAESDNSFGGPVSFSNNGMNDVAIKNSGALSLGGATIGRDFTVEAAGNITQSASTAIVIGGTTTVTAPTFDVTLDQSGNDFSAVSISDAHNATLVDTNAVNLIDSTLTGGLSVTATDIALNGTISSHDSQTYIGNITLTADTGLESSSAGISLPGISNGYNHALGISNNGTGSLGATHNLQSLAKTGGGTLVLTGTNDYTGGTTIDAGTLELSSTGTLAPGGDVTINNSGIFSVGNDVTIRGLYSDSNTSGVEIQNGHVLTLNLPSGDAGSYAAFAGSVAGYGTVTLEKTGPGTFAFTGTASASPYSQPASHEGFGQNLVWPQSDIPGHFQLNVNSGTFQLGDSDTHNYGEIVGDIFIDAPATFIYDTAGNSEASLYSTPTGTGTFRKQGTENLTLNGSFNGKVAVDAGTLTIGTSLTVGSLEGTGTTSIASGHALTVAGTFGSKDYSGSITGDGTLVKAGFNTLTLSGENSYAGGTVIYSGTLKINSSATLPSGGSVTINGTNGPASLNLDGGEQTIGDLTFGGEGGSNFAANSVVLGTGTLTLDTAAGITYAGGTEPSTATIGATSPFSGNDPRGGTLAIGTGDHAFAIDDSINAEADLAVYARLVDGGEVAGTIEKTGAGTLLLSGSGSSFSGNFAVTDGRLLVASDNAAGTGTLTVGSGAILAASELLSHAIHSEVDHVSLSNPVVLEGNSALGITDKFGVSLVLDNVKLPHGTVYLAGDETTWLTGTIDAEEAGTVTFDSGERSEIGKIIFAGSVTNNPTHFVANGAAILIGNANALRGGLSYHANGGYIGVAKLDLDVPAPSAGAVLAAIDPDGFSGTFGFDSDVDNIGVQTFDVHELSFSSFTDPSFTLGSITGAQITGTFTPASTGYAFGNGGGVLFVTSDLGGNYSTTVNSAINIPDNALTVVFQGDNSYTGNLTVANSIAILNSPTALPDGGHATLGLNGYLGYTENFTPATNFTAFASRIVGATSTSILGFDSAVYLGQQLNGDVPGDPVRHIADTIDLSSNGPIYLGTATQAELSGTISASSDDTLYLAAVGKKATLTVSSSLTSDRVSNVVVGLPTPVLGAGTVTLGGNNTYQNTTLNSGALLVSHGSKWNGSSIVAGPLGTNTLTVSSNAESPVLAQIADHGEVRLHNKIVLDGSLQLGMPTLDSDSEEYESYDHGYDQLALAGQISGTGGLTIFDNTLLDSANTFEGGVTLRNGRLAIGNNDALGDSAGLLSIQPWSPEDESSYVALYAEGGDRTLGNGLALNLSGQDYLFVGGEGSLTFQGPVSVSGMGSIYVQSHPLFLAGNISGGGGVQAGGGIVVLRGTNTYTGGTYASGGSVIFGSLDSIPANPNLTTTSFGYIGLAAPPDEGTLQSSFVDKFNHASGGTIGFDSLGEGTNIFSDNISLAGGFSSASVGSASRAILTGTITPNGEYYRFGGGGGLLELCSALNDGDTLGRNLEVSSPTYTPLTLRLGGYNTYSGGTFVSGSALIFKTGSMPDGESVGKFTIANGGYVGTEDTETTPANFLGRFAEVGRGVIGFDSFDGTYTLDAEQTIDLTTVESDDKKVYLGTATSATLGSTLTIIPASSAYRFAGYKGGHLLVESTLSDVDVNNARSVEVGDPDNPATAGSPVEPDKGPSVVTLAGNNSYTGGTTLYAGKLMVGQSNGTIGTNATTALGTGPLKIEVDSIYSETSKTLAPAADQVVVDNDIVLHDRLTVDVPNSDRFTLAGDISAAIGDLQLYKSGTGTLYLGGDNSASHAELYVAGGNVTFETTDSVGLGPVKLGISESSSATFLQDSTVYGIYGDDPSQLISFGSNALTIDQQFDSHYQGQFVGSGDLTFQNTSDSSKPRELVLTNINPSFTGAVTFGTNVAVITTSSNAFAAASGVTLEGGHLALEDSAVLENFTISSGTLAGTGTFRPKNTIAAGAGIVLAPGFSPGTLHFDGSLLTNPASATLTLAGGGTYEWQLQDATNANGGWDKIDVAGTVNVTATSGSPFDFKLIPLATNFDMASTYAWTVLTSDGITNFDQTKFTLIPTGSFVDAVNAGGGFSLGLSGNDLILNFNPAAVPEPSTWALLIAGLGVIGFATLRRKRV